MSLNVAVGQKATSNVRLSMFALQPEADVTRVFLYVRLGLCRSSRGTCVVHYCYRSIGLDRRKASRPTANHCGFRRSISAARCWMRSPRHLFPARCFLGLVASFFFDPCSIRAPAST